MGLVNREAEFQKAGHPRRQKQKKMLNKNKKVPQKGIIEDCFARIRRKRAEHDKIREEKEEEKREIFKVENEATVLLDKEKDKVAKQHTFSGNIRDRKQFLL